VIIVVCTDREGALKLCVAAVKALRKMEKRGSKQDEIQFNLPPKRLHFLSFIPPLNANGTYLAGFFVESLPVLDKTQGSGAVFS
jgi:hypothetical protein